MRDLQDAWTTAMRRGDFAAAWAINDAVLAARDPATRDDARLPYHLRWVWDGRPFDGRDVLVRCYHGLGDTLQFARYLPALAARAASVKVEAPPALLPVLAGMAGIDRLLPFDPAAPTPAGECDIEIMELAHALRLAPDAVAVPYLRAQQQLPLPLREGVGGRGSHGCHPSPLPPPARGGGVGRAVIGLCWQAGVWDAARSVSPALIAPLAARRPAVALQPAPTALPVRNPNGCPRGIADTAALIADLDLVITVDSMIAHLAGAIGVPTWLLLKHAADWRWMERRCDSPWYPSMRLYRQPAPGDWRSVVARVTADLTAAD